jgi:hypothetical protein
MTGAALLIYVKRGLREYGVAVEDSTERDAELCDLITEGRDDLIAAFSLAAPKVVEQVVTLEVQADDRLYRFPAVSPDPYRVIEVRTITDQRELEPAARLNVDGGEYRWNSLRELKVADWSTPDGGIEIVAIMGGSSIDGTTIEANIGLPTTCHRCLAKYAIAQALERGGERSPDRALAMFQRELDRLERTYGEYDANGGAALREAIMRSIGFETGDMLY